MFIRFLRKNWSFVILGPARGARRPPSPTRNRTPPAPPWPYSGITTRRREAGYSHDGDRQGSTRRPDIRTKLCLKCVCVCVQELCHSAVSFFSQQASDAATASATAADSCSNSNGSSNNSSNGSSNSSSSSSNGSRNSSSNSCKNNLKHKCNISCCW